MDLLDLMAEAGFQVVIGKDVLYIETTQKAYQQTVGDKVVQRDHVVIFQKLEAKFHLDANIKVQESNNDELVRAYIKDILMQYPGITKDRIYDELIARLISVGRVEPHDFERQLRLIAAQDTEGTGWFIQEE